jgi:hypothetical protein
MKLLINTPFELDVELVDQMPKYLKFNSNWVSIQSVETSDSEMSTLIAMLKFSSDKFEPDQLTKIDEFTIAWG